ncbi:CDP-diacylglycerol--glycerol-3-phosphate 3-phosphatidyltransferase [Kurthia huakuii]|uniref:CDP-diacylglycerol--glycerol-3-phosphate 3-phosphatidyltransferase n=1 Tax=Kurthia huakuii TaxID=1421019 RepID=UPI000494FC63|nr:CDP-diacylglycerol--glycerol-3-phosphate 3-phosphatidyltransferase [Kurthia huakuii]MBM7698264.1 CDP-diacylglycerol--glycerol-3-phosphate 3-phosphatidyltransferase [Kurthia huakuii]
MNLPNKITVSRVVMIPIFVVLMVVNFGWGNVTLLGTTMPIEHLVGAIVFIIASITDFFDGYLARKYNLVTNMGKFLDPLADKLLVTAAFIILVQWGVAPAWVIIVIVAREFAVTGLRSIGAEQNVIIAASNLGKLKTWSQMVALAFLLLHNIIFELWNFPFDQIMLYVAFFFTLLSGLDYFWKNRRLLLDSM